MARNPRADQIGMGGRMLSVQVGGKAGMRRVRRKKPECSALREIYAP